MIVLAEVQLATRPTVVSAVPPILKIHLKAWFPAQQEINLELLLAFVTSLESKNNFQCANWGSSISAVKKSNE